jgi:hypothetical protein
MSNVVGGLIELRGEGDLRVRMHQVVDDAH